MSDFALTWDNDSGVMDLSVVDNDVVADDGLQTSVLLSLGTDRRVEDLSTLKPGEEPHGWWGDEFLPDSEDLHGSRLWQDPKDAKIIEESLAWMLDDNLASDVTAIVETDGTRGGYDIEIHRPNSESIGFRFDRVWDGEAGKW